MTTNRDPEVRLRDVAADPLSLAATVLGVTSAIGSYLLLTIPPVSGLDVVFAVGGAAGAAVWLAVTTRIANRSPSDHERQTEVTG